MNVVVKIGSLRIDLHEQVVLGDPDFDKTLGSDILQHRELMNLRMTDLILNYFVDRKGI